MPIIYSNDRLLDIMTEWRRTGVRAAFILVDEETTDPDKSRDRAVRHRLQSALLLRSQGFGVFVVKYGMDGAHGERSVFAGGLGPDLDAALPGTANVYEKGPFETNGFDNVRLVADIAQGNYTEVVIMGQSTNACCAATARGAVGLQLKVHTCESILRGGAVETLPPVYFGLGFAGWPDGTTVYAAL
jgi:hypothetical protein